MGIEHQATWSVPFERTEQLGVSSPLFLMLGETL